MTGGDLLSSLGVELPACIALIGGGGKTTLMFALSRALVATGRTCVTTTTTRLLPPEPTQSRVVLVGEQLREIAEPLRRGLQAERHVTVAPRRSHGGRSKLVGFAPEDVDRLFDERLADAVLVEADGSAGRSLKAHAAHEPALPGRSTLVVVVIGADGVGAPLDAAHVHRPDLFASRTGLPLGAPVTPDAIAAALLHPDGPLREVAREVPVTICLTKVGDDRTRDDAAALASAFEASQSQHALRMAMFREAPPGR